MECWRHKISKCLTIAVYPDEIDEGKFEDPLVCLSHNPVIKFKACLVIIRVTNLVSEDFCFLLTKYMEIYLLMYSMS